MTSRFPRATFFPSDALLGVFIVQRGIFMRKSQSKFIGEYMKRFTDTTVSKYDLETVPEGVICFNAPDAIKSQKELPKELKWGSEKRPPAIGDRVSINFNQLGGGVVESYFWEHGWLGVCVKLNNAPAWKRKQQKVNWDCALVYAPELVGY